MILFISMAIACSPIDVLKIKCETICLQDGDDMGIIHKNKCYCANQRDISKAVMRLNRNITTNEQEKERSLYGDY